MIIIQTPTLIELVSRVYFTGKETTGQKKKRKNPSFSVYV